MHSFTLYSILGMALIWCVTSCTTPTDSDGSDEEPTPTPSATPYIWVYPPTPFEQDETSDARKSKTLPGETRLGMRDLSSGFLTSTLGGNDDVIRAIALSSDGANIFFAGRSEDASEQSEFLVGKMTSAGVFDTTFSNDGWTTTDFASNNDDIAHALAWQTDGKVVIGGRYKTGSSDWNFALARYLTNGALDSGFGTSGLQNVNFGTGLDSLRGLAMQSDGGILAAGYASHNNQFDFVSARFRGTTGYLDTTFGNGGTYVVDVVSGQHDVATSLAVMPDGKFILAGATYNSSNWDIALVRYLTNGAIDSGFNTTGRVTSTIGASRDILWGVAVDNNSKIYGAGETGNGSDADILLVRYLSSGVLDTSYSSDGVVTTTISSAHHDIARAVALESSTGRANVAGTASGDKVNFAILRFNTDGSQANNFTSPGTVVHSLGSATDSAFGLALDPSDGTIYMGGRSNNGTNYDIGIVKQAQ